MTPYKDSEALAAQYRCMVLEAIEQAEQKI